MRNKSNESDIVFHIDKEKRIVVCRLLNCKWIPHYRVRKISLELSRTINCIQNEFIGIARCAPEDEWDEEYGKRLAFYRARKKRAYAINAEIKRMTKSVDKILDRIEKECYSNIPSEDEL